MSKCSACAGSGIVAGAGDYTSEECQECRGRGVIADPERWEGSPSVEQVRAHAEAHPIMDGNGQVGVYDTTGRWCPAGLWRGATQPQPTWRLLAALPRRVACLSRVAGAWWAAKYETVGPCTPCTADGDPLPLVDRDELAEKLAASVDHCERLQAVWGRVMRERDQARAALERAIAVRARSEADEARRQLAEATTTPADATRARRQAEEGAAPNLAAALCDCRMPHQQSLRGVK